MEKSSGQNQKYDQPPETRGDTNESRRIWEKSWKIKAGCDSIEKWGKFFPKVTKVKCAGKVLNWGFAWI